MNVQTYNKNATLGGAQKNYAFTLSEVLLTLLIIGIVAALTLPNLMKSSKDIEFQNSWKKAFSELSQAEQQINTDNGGDFIGLCADWDSTCLRNLFAGKIKAIKTCDNPITDGCTASASRYLNGATTANGIDINDNANLTAVVASSGYSVKFREQYFDCSGNSWWGCGWMQIDINGLKGPNVAGKDIYFAGINKSKLIPFGADGSVVDGATDCATTASGAGCSSVYLSK